MKTDLVAGPMPEYRRNRVQGGTYFVTLALADRRSDLLVRGIDALRGSLAHEAPLSVPDRRLGGPAGTHACGVDASRGRRRVLHALGTDQTLVLGGDTTGRGPLGLPRSQGRARALAAPLLGTHGARRGGFLPAPHPTLDSCGPRSRECRHVRGLDALAVNHRPGRAGLASRPLAVAPHQIVVDQLPGAVVAQTDEPSRDHAPGRETSRNRPPARPTAQDVADDIDDIAHRPGPLAATRRLTRQERRQDIPFGIGPVASIAPLRAAIMSSGGRGPHRGLVERSVTLTKRDLPRLHCPVIPATVETASKS